LPAPRNASIRYCPSVAPGATSRGQFTRVQAPSSRRSPACRVTGLFIGQPVPKVVPHTPIFSFVPFDEEIELVSTQLLPLADIQHYNPHDLDMFIHRAWSLGVMLVIATVSFVAAATNRVAG